MADIDTAAIRDRAGTSYNTWSDHDLYELCDAVDALRAENARLAAELKDAVARVVYDENVPDGQFIVGSFYSGEGDRG